MDEDVLRLTAQRRREKAAAAAERGAVAGEEPASRGWERQLNTFMIADFALVVLFLLLLVAAVAEQAASKDESHVLADLFFKLWPVLIQPALGLLMAGSLLSGATQFAKDKGWLQ